MVDVPALCARVRKGEGVEAILADMGLDNALALQWLKDHPTAREDIAEAKAHPDAVRTRDVAQAEFQARQKDGDVSA